LDCDFSIMAKTTPTGIQGNGGIQIVSGRSRVIGQLKSDQLPRNSNLGSYCRTARVRSAPRFLNKLRSVQPCSFATSRFMSLNILNFFRCYRRTFGGTKFNNLSFCGISLFQQIDRHIPIFLNKPKASETSFRFPDITGQSCCPLRSNRFNSRELPPRAQIGPVMSK
jgi:hypothetical protein